MHTSSFNDLDQFESSVLPKLGSLAPRPGPDCKVTAFVGAATQFGHTRVRMSTDSLLGVESDAIHVMEKRWNRDVLNEGITQNSGVMILAHRLPNNGNILLRDLPGRGILMDAVLSQNKKEIYFAGLFNSGGRVSPDLNSMNGHLLLLLLKSPEDSNKVEGVSWRLTASPLAEYESTLRKKFGLSESDERKRPLILRCHEEYKRLRGLRPFMRNDDERKMLDLLSYVFDLADVESQWRSEVLRMVTVTQVTKVGKDEARAAIEWSVSDLGLPEVVTLKGGLGEVQPGDLVSVRIKMIGGKFAELQPLEILAVPDRLSDAEWQRRMAGLPGAGGGKLTVGA